MKYNKSEIMKNAWDMYNNRTIYPIYSSERKRTFGDCLRSAWYSAKYAAQEEAELASQMGKSFENDMEITIDCTTYSLRRWTNYGKDRIYVSGGKNRNAFVDLLSDYHNVRCEKLVKVIRSMKY